MPFQHAGHCVRAAHGSGEEGLDDSDGDQLIFVISTAAAATATTVNALCRKDEGKLSVTIVSACVEKMAKSI